MFYVDNGLFLAKARLAVDVCRRQATGFISHAHADHMARHELALCTPITAELYRCRLGMRRTLLMPLRQPIEFGGLRLTTYPAGHVLGSAMLLAEDGERSLLYTGDFRLTPSATAEAAELPRADILIMETTFGQARYRMPPRAEVCGQLVEIVRQALADGRTPVVHAYALGKAQEVTRILTAAGIPVLQHRSAHRVSQVYEAAGCDLGEYALWEGGRAAAGHALVTPPRGQKGGYLEGVCRPLRIAVTGWAIDRGTRHRLDVEHALPLSDHADYDELFQAVEQVGATEIYCTHGPASFVDDLAGAGYPAFPLEGARQTRLF